MTVYFDLFRCTEIIELLLFVSKSATNWASIWKLYLYIQCLSTCTVNITQWRNLIVSFSEKFNFFGRAREFVAGFVVIANCLFQSTAYTRFIAILNFYFFEKWHDLQSENEVSSNKKKTAFKIHKTFKIFQSLFFCEVSKKANKNDDCHYRNGPKINHKLKR